MRRNPTPGERVAWEILRDRRFLGYKFRRQVPLAGFIVDFYCRELRLAVEIDGATHRSDEARAQDQDRDQVLTELGIRTFRMQDGPNLGHAFESLQREILQRAPPPLRITERGQGVR